MSTGFKRSLTTFTQARYIEETLIIRNVVAFLPLNYATLLRYRLFDILAYSNILHGTRLAKKTETATSSRERADMYVVQCCCITIYRSPSCNAKCLMCSRLE